MAAESPPTYRLPLRRLRRHNNYRAINVSLTCGIVASINFGSGFYLRLPEFIKSVPNGHFLFGVVCYTITLAFTVAARRLLRLRRFRREGAPSIRNPTALAIIEEVSAVLGISATPVVAATGGFRAYVIGKKNIISIDPAGLGLRSTDSAKFKFSIAHELAHCATRDFAAEEIVKSNYIACCVILGYTFMESAVYSIYIAYSFWSSVKPGGIVVGLPMWQSLMFDALDSVSFAATIGVLLAILLAESRAARRGREFHADALAAAVAGLPSPAAAGSDDVGASLWSRLKLSLGFGEHPSVRDRNLAMLDQSVVEETDGVFIFSMFFLTAIMIETMLQFATMLTVSSDNAPHRVTILYPLNFCLAGVFVGSVYVLCCWLLLGRAAPPPLFKSHTQFPDNIRKFALKMVRLGAPSTLLVLLTSQATWWDFRVLGWGPISYVEFEGDRLMILAVSALAVASVGTFARFRSIGAHRASVRALLSLIPVTIVAVMFAWRNMAI
jgi:hypothetical protein